MAKRHTPHVQFERMMLVLRVARDPETGRFTFTSEWREDLGPFQLGTMRDASPTRFAVLFHALCEASLQAWKETVAERWDDALERERVDVDEVVALLRLPTEP